VHLIHLHTSKQIYLHVLQRARMVSTQTHSHIFALHATQLAPPAMATQVDSVILALFHCIFNLLSVWLRAALGSMP